MTETFKYIPWIAFVLCVITYVIEPNDTTMRGFLIGLGILTIDALKQTILLIRRENMAENARHIEATIEEMGDRIESLSKQIDSMKTNIQMRQLGR